MPINTIIETEGFSVYFDETSAIIIGVFFAFLFFYSVVVVRIHNFMATSFNLVEEEDDPMQNPLNAMPLNIRKSLMMG